MKSANSLTRTQFKRDLPRPRTHLLPDRASKAALVFCREQLLNKTLLLLLLTALRVKIPILSIIKKLLEGKQLDPTTACLTRCINNPIWIYLLSSKHLTSGSKQILLSRWLPATWCRMTTWVYSSLLTQLCHSNLKAKCMLNTSSSSLSNRMSKSLLCSLANHNLKLLSKETIVVARPSNN